MNLVHFNVWLFTRCPTVYKKFITAHNLPSRGKDKLMTKHLENMLAEGVGHWANMELIYINMPSLN